VFPNLHKYFLQEIIGILMGADKAADMPVEPFAVVFYNQIECFFLLTASIQTYDFEFRHVSGICFAFSTTILPNR
jgi:hypothetical protein